MHATTTNKTITITRVKPTDFKVLYVLRPRICGWWWFQIAYLLEEEHLYLVGCVQIGDRAKMPRLAHYSTTMTIISWCCCPYHYAVPSNVCPVQRHFAALSIFFCPRFWGLLFDRKKKKRSIDYSSMGFFFFSQIVVQKCFRRRKLCIDLRKKKKKIISLVHFFTHKIMYNSKVIVCSTPVGY